MELYVGDKVQLRKSHPCGSNTWEITRLGMDIRMRCLGCSHSVLLSRSKFMKQLKAIITRGDTTRGVLDEYMRNRRKVVN
jgi:hypothetical protein